jgi:uncharacterized protein YjbI with pentapeptide repeats
LNTQKFQRRDTPGSLRTRCPLREASLWRTLLISALLVNADIRDADLRQTNLRHAWMQGARLARVIMDEETDLFDANTEGAHYDDSP